MNITLGLIPFPMFQHLMGCNFIFSFHTHDGSETAQVMFVFDSTAGLCLSFTVSEEKSQILVLFILQIYGTAMVGKILMWLDTVAVK